MACFNAALYQALKSSFDQAGWQIESVTPYFVTNQINFTQELASSLLKKPEILIQENIIKTAVYGTDAQKENKIKGSKDISLPWLFIVFFGLLFTLIVIIIFRLNIKSKSQPNLNQTVTPTLVKIIPTQIISPTIILNPTISTTPSAEIMPKTP